MDECHVFSGCSQHYPCAAVTFSRSRVDVDCRPRSRRCRVQGVFPEASNLLLGVKFLQRCYKVRSKVHGSENCQRLGLLLCGLLFRFLTFRPSGFDRFSRLLTWTRLGCPLCGSSLFAQLGHVFRDHLLLGLGHAPERLAQEHCGSKIVLLSPLSQLVS